MVTNTEISTDKTTLSLTGGNGHVGRFNVQWLRFHCRCPKCCPEFSGQYLVDKERFNNAIKISTAVIEDNNLLMTIDDEPYEISHVTTIPLEWLEKNCLCDKCLADQIEQRNFRYKSPSNLELPTVEYNEFMKPDGLFECLEKLIEAGFCLVKNVPSELKIVLELAEMIGPIQMTLYDKMFDIKYKPDPYNTSLTTCKMVFHQDLPYYESSPGVQLLHAIEFDESIEGGESQLVDLFQAAEILRKESPEDFDALCRIPAVFETKDVNRPIPAWYENLKTHIEVDYFGKIVAINWNPGVEGTLRAREKDTQAYYEAYSKFHRIIRRKELEVMAPFRFKLTPGDMLIFNNHRMAHAREEFRITDPSKGTRHLQGCYVNIDDMKSKYIVLGHKLNKKIVPPKVGNRCSF